MTRYIASLVVWLAILSVPAMADVVYENGPDNDTVDAWTINFGFAVSNTFTVVGGSTTISAFQFEAWLLPGDTLSSVELSITSDELGGTTFFDEVVTGWSNDNCFTNVQGYTLCNEVASFNGPTLATGTYWVNLQNATVPNGDPVYWDENSGIGCHSPGCPSQASENELGTIPSESFTIYGSPAGSVPEPGGIVLFGSGILSVFSMMRWKLR